MTAVRKKILHIAGPIILENVLVFSASLITTAMVGRLSAMDISTQGLSMRLVNTLMLLFKGLGVGVTVATAHAAGDEGRCQKALRRTLAVSLLIALALTALVFTSPRLFLRILTGDPAILEASEWYMRAMGFVIPITCAHHLLVGYFNGHGQTRLPMISAAAVNAVNILLGSVLIFGKLGVPALGIRGAACAYLAAQAVGIVILLIAYRRMYPPAVSAAPDASLLREVVTVGLPSAAESLLFNAAMILVSRALLPYGTDCYAAYHLGIQAEDICYMVGLAFVTTSTTLSAMAVGRRDGELYRSSFRELLRLGTAVAAASALILLLLPVQLMRLLTDKSELIDIGKYYLYAMVPAQFPQVYNNILNGFARSSGHKRLPMWVTAAGLWCVRVPVAVLTGLVFQGNILWIWTGIALDQFTRMTILLVFFRTNHVLRRTLDSFSRS